jgi:hypothetical protein
VFGDKIDELISSYPQQGLCSLPSVNVLIKEAVEWASKEGYEPPIPTIVRQSVKEVASAIYVVRPQRARSMVSMHEASLTDEMGGQRQRREMLEAVEKEAAKQAARETAAREREEALEIEVQRQSNNHPLNEAEWKSHIDKCLIPVVRYIFKRFEKGGDRYEAVEFYRGPRVFDTTFANTISLIAANHCIEKRKHYHCLDKPEIMQALKASFKFIKEAADKVTSSDVYVLHWHLDLNARLNK